jgi:hypothetical protein
VSCIFLALSACDLGGAAPLDTVAPATPFASATADGLEVTVGLDAERYLTQANTIRCIKAPCPSNAVAPVLQVLLSVTNTTAEPVSLDLPSGQRFELQVFDETGTVVTTWSMDKLFMMSTQTVTLAPGERQDWLTELPFVPDLAGDFEMQATVIGAAATPRVDFVVALP